MHIFNHRRCVGEDVGLAASGHAAGVVVRDDHDVARPVDALPERRE